ncbi:MAG TPA: hypothetical protein VF599_05825 [Pyrinomonadaceae bacterium]
MRFLPLRYLPGFVIACLLACPSAFAAQITLVPPSGKFPQSFEKIKKYAGRSDWKVEVPVRREAGRVSPQALRLIVPSPFTAGGDSITKNSLLPTTPQSSIYRFKYLDISADTKPAFPFRYVEVDWNTEGAPRGPNGSFITPHYDFHFYLKDRAFVEKNMECMTVGKTCDSLKTGYSQMRHFLDLPPDRFIPEKYFPDNDSSIAAMGMHNLDGSFDYTVDNVNHNPVIIYGTFDGELAFLEVSMTLYGFQDAIKAARQRRKLSWNILQPKAYAYPWWATKVTLEYLPESRSFAFEFGGFEFQKVESR